MVGLVRYGTIACLLLMAAAVSAAPVTVVFPANGSYVIWARTPDQHVAQSQEIVRGASTTLSPEVESGDTVYVLDRSNEMLATKTIPDGAASLKFQSSDFGPIAGKPVTSGPQQTAAPATPSAAAPPPAPETEPGPLAGFLRLFGLLFGLVIAGGVVWAIMQLTKSRGQVLIDVARKAGVEVPDPDAEPPLAPMVPVPEFKPRPPIEKIPDEATRPPVIPAGRLAGAARPSAAGRGSRPNGPLQLVGYEGIASGIIYKLEKDTVVIGRDGDCDLAITDSTVSRLHARIVPEGDGNWAIEDAGSSNGVFINGTRIDSATLTLGDEVKIGDNYFRLEEA